MYLHDYGHGSRPHAPAVANSADGSLVAQPETAGTQTRSMAAISMPTSIPSRRALTPSCAAL